MQTNATRGRAARRAVSIATLAAGLLVVATPTAAMTRDIDGTAGADHLSGTTGSDLIFGLEGPDVLRGRAGEDRLVGGPGDDLLKGGPGRDAYICGSGFDVVVSDFSRHPDEHAGAGCEAVIFEE
jgi:Ca2+-binding RTX toxin-like protein